MAGPELSVVCRNCGSEVSPYVTECPYCGTRIRKRAPRLEREGDEIRIREGRREKKRRRDAERRERNEERRVGFGEDLSTKPIATFLLLAIPAVVYILLEASVLDAQDFVILGPVDSEPWRYLTAPFAIANAGMLFICGVVIAACGPALERRLGSIATFLLALACGALGMLAAVGVDKAIGDGFAVAAGPNGIALGLLAAYVAIREPERRADPDDSYDPIAAGVAAAVLLAMPIVFAFSRSLGRDRRRPRGRPVRLYGDACPEAGVSKYTALDDDLHAYLVEHGSRQDEVLARVQEETAAMGSISAMQIAPDQGAFMEILTRAIGAQEALEIGTFTGYSAISIARGLAPAGRLLCLELSEEFAETAAGNLAAAGVADRVEIITGPAVETLRKLPEREHFDLVFIDADKTGYPVYFEEALKRTRSGGLILLDNMLQDGRVLDPDPDDESTNAIVALNEKLAGDERVDIAMVAIADGITIARKR